MGGAIALGGALDDTGSFDDSGAAVSVFVGALAAATGFVLDLVGGAAYHRYPAQADVRLEPLTDD